MSYSKTIIEVYVSTGAKNAMYTLRQSRLTILDKSTFVRDAYVRNLSTNEEEAERKALEHTEILKERFSDTEISIEYTGFEEEIGNRRRGKLSVYDTQAIEDIEAGVFPFGKHKGSKIEDAPDGYIVWLADQQKNVDEMKAPMVALTAVASAIAIDRGLYAKREAARAERMEKDMQSNFIGKIGERMVFEGELTCFAKMFPADEGGGVAYYINKIRVGKDIVTYLGNKLGETGDFIKIKATIKGHNEYQGVKSTKVNRPSTKGV